MDIPFDPDCFLIHTLLCGYCADFGKLPPPPTPLTLSRVVAFKRLKVAAIIVINIVLWSFHMPSLVLARLQASGMAAQGFSQAARNLVMLFLPK